MPMRGSVRVAFAISEMHVTARDTGNVAEREAARSLDSKSCAIRAGRMVYDLKMNFYTASIRPMV